MNSMTLGNSTLASYTLTEVDDDIIQHHVCFHSVHSIQSTWGLTTTDSFALSAMACLFERRSPERWFARNAEPSPMYD